MRANWVLILSIVVTSLFCTLVSAAESGSDLPACFSDYQKSSQALEDRSQQLFELLSCFVRQGEANCETQKQSALHSGFTNLDIYQVKALKDQYRYCQRYPDYNDQGGMYKRN